MWDAMQGEGREKKENSRRVEGRLSHVREDVSVAGERERTEVKIEREKMGNQ